MIYNNSLEDHTLISSWSFFLTRISTYWILQWLCFLPSELDRYFRTVLISGKAVRLELLSAAYEDTFLME